MEPFGADKSLTQIYHGWFRDGTPLDNTPPPGYLTPGIDTNYSGTNPNVIAGKSIQKMYLDWNTSNNISTENSFQLTEPAIYYQSAYIMLLSRLMSNTVTSSTAVVYDDALVTNWSDSSWNCLLNFSNTTPIKIGSKSIKVNYAASTTGGAAAFSSTAPINFASSNAALQFWAYSTTAQNIKVSTTLTIDTSNESNVIPISIPANTWTNINITRAQLGNPSTIKRIILRREATTAGTIIYDQLQVVQ